MVPFRTIVGGNVVFSINLDSPCPCGSTLPSSDCCWIGSKFHKKSAKVTPKPPRTNHSLTRCYASDLADCSTKISREHFISRSLLQFLNSNNNLLVSGFPWVDSGGKFLPPSSLTSKILCERHNSSLSPLDSIAVRLFNAFDERGATGSGQKLLYLFNGHDLERWLLKILCGFACSGSLPLDFDRDISIPKGWCEILFGNSDFAPNQGLYVCKDIGHQFKARGDLAFMAITNNERLTGFGMYICGYELILSMSGMPNRRFDGRQFAYRPFEFYTTGTEFEKSIIFSWDGLADNGTIVSKIKAS